MKRVNTNALARTYRVWASAIVCTGVLSACGGAEEGLEVDVRSEGVRIMAFETALVPGVAQSNENLITSLSWTAQPQDARAPQLTLGNADCAVVIKNQENYGSGATGATRRTGASRWECALSVTVGTQVDKEYKYNLVLQALTDANEIKSFGQVIAVVPNPNPPASLPTERVQTTDPQANSTDASASASQE